MAVLTTRVQRFFFLSTTSEKSFIPYKASATVQALKVSPVQPKVLSLNLCLFFDFSVLTAQHSRSQLIINGIVFLLSATKYCIWTHPNSIVHNKVNFDSDCIIKEIKSMLFSRQRIENYPLNTKHSQILKFLCNALIY